MKESNKIYIYIGIIIVAIAIITLILFNTIFYDYKGRLSSYLNTYYSSESNNIDDINTLINRYKNNTNRTNSINELIDDFINNKIGEYNTNYSSVSDLDTSKNRLIDKIDFLLNNIVDYIEVRNDKNSYVKAINNLYESKVYYLNGLDYFNNKDFNEAYESFKNVISNDFYFEDTTNKIDACFDSEVNEISNEVNNLNVITDETSIDEKLSIYKNIFEYLINKKNNTKFDLTKSKTYTNLFNDVVNNIKNTYIDIAKSLVLDSNYTDAIDKLSEGATLLTKEEIDVTSLITLEDEYKKMLPVSLTSVEKSFDGSLIKEELAIFDKDNKNYARALTITKGIEKKSSVTYNLNKEYKFLSTSVAITKEVSEKNKYYGRIKIYADDKEIYNSRDISINFQTNILKLDISDVNSLKIEYNISNNYLSSKNDIVVFVLGNPMLEKY
ncbi:MAG: NPCBM/NEW2 domain-containing protein [Bacilli bacterium]|nr:NPCBM/NEW2 domain-containing protein [Bacilli bacterium]